VKQVDPVRNWPLVPSKTAVLVVDVQQSEYTDETIAEAPEMAQAMRDRMLPALSRLVGSAREAGCEIIYTVIEALTEDGRDRSLDQQEDDIVLPKTSSGVFNSTNLTYLLRNMGLDRVIVAGLLTDQCVDMAVRDGADLGFYMICAADACVTKTDERHARALSAFGGYCRTQTVDEILQDLRAVG
jgi:nicotinamidase-related amidase